MSKKIFLFLFLGIFSISLFSQETTRNKPTELELYQKMKSEGTIPLGFQFSNPEILFKTNGKKPGKGTPNDKNAGCGCYVAPDATYTQAFAANDDGSTASLAIPFTFQLYGTNYTSLFINNNGNISFGTSYSSFSSNPFPDPSFVMVAPFWGDVDTRGVGGGSVSYKITPTAMYVNWVGVGYYNSQTDKLNTFQLIITNGLDPVLPAGNNIAFCYEDMQWTTGSASGGTNGFGGTPSTVGVNKGDGTSFIQIGRFDQPGAAYDGGGGLNDGVSWLDNQSLYFNVASSTNIPPIANFTPNIFNGAGGGACDTLKMCGANDTLIIDALFLSPEIGETTTVSVNFNGNTGFTLLNNSPGNPANISVGVVALPTNGGMNTITYTATDNGTPAQTTIVDVNVYVDTTNLNSFNPVISGDLDFCDGGNSVLDVAPSNLTSYIWSTGSIDTTITVDSSDTYWVTVENQGCYKTVSVDVVEHVVNPIVTGDTIVCPGDSVLLNVTPGYDSYLWSSSATDIFDSVYVQQGTYTVTADSGACSGTSDPFTVNLFPAAVTIVGNTTYCFGDSVLLDAGPSFDTYLWSNGQTTQTTYVTQGTYTVDVTLGTCNAVSSPHTVNVINVPKPIITGLPSICAGSPVILDADSVGTGYDTFSWNTTPVQTSQTITVSQADTLIVIATILGCSDTSAQFIVSENPLPLPIISGNLFYCANDSSGATLSTVTDYTSYVWSNTDVTPTSVVSAGPISLTVTDSNGCVGTVSTTVTSATPSTSISGLQPFCIGETIIINAGPGFSAYSWDSGENSASISAGHGSHTVTVTDINGCTALATLVLNGNPTPAVSFTISPTNQSEPNQPVIFTDASTISSGNIDFWNWNFDVSAVSGANPNGASTQGPHSVTYTEQGPLTVSLTVTSDSNCVASYSEDYLIISDIVIPNVISPNGDGSNDFLVFTNLEFRSGNKLTVLNRWGGKIFETENYKNDWSGGDHSEGTYFYILTVDDLDDPIKGTFTLFK
ncbi:MAG: gliding motility-associated C-terminal domain-containing protein [Vicingaceae bacterium]|nr:gliding motility-associated C-terminal domain-containing protein [Vicingaceae bacterium]